MHDFDADAGELIEAVGQNNFYTGLDFLFQTIIERFERYGRSFSSILLENHQKIKFHIPLTLKVKLTDYVVMIIDDFFGKGGFYPKISPFKKIPEDDLLSLCKTYFNEDGFRFEEIVYLMYLFYIKPFEKLKMISKNLEDSKILDKVPHEIKSGIIKDYLNFENYLFPIEVSFEKKQEMQRTGLLPLEIGKRVIPQYLKAPFHDLSRIDKKILLDIAWSAFVIKHYERRRYTDEKFSLKDKEVLIDLAISEYIELYNQFYKQKK